MVDQTDIVAAAQVLPVSPLSPLGIVKLNTAAELVPLFVTLAEVPASPVVVVPTLMVAADHVSPVSHFAPLGIVKLNTAAPLVPELVTEALVPGSQVVVVQTLIVAASQVSHFRSTLASVNVTVSQSSLVNTISSQSNSALTIDAHVSQVSPFSHSGIVKSNTAALVVPEFTTLAEVQGSHVVVDHTVIVAAVPVSHFSHFKLEY